MRYFLPLLLILIGSGCSPLKTSPHDERHQWELTVHEVQTNLDDLRHDINCFQVEMQILDGRIKSFENSLASLKQQDLTKQQAKIDQISQQISLFEKKWGSLEKGQEGGKETLEHLASNANETHTALAQFKSRIEELEQAILLQNRRFEALAKVKGNIESLASQLKGIGCKTYKVRSGDTLEKIAKAHKVPVDKLKKTNNLEQDLIVVGQELKIPTD